MNTFSTLQTLIHPLISFISTFNWIDVVIIAVFGFYIVEGYALGFIAGVVDFVSFTLSFILALRYYSSFGHLLVKTFSMPTGFANALGFITVAFVSEFLIGFLFRRFITSSAMFKKAFFGNPAILRVNNILGILPGILSSLILLTFFLTLVVTLPLSPTLKNYVLSSKIGGFLVANTQGIEKQLNNVFGGAVNETLNFLTVEPKSNEIVSLHFSTTNYSEDKQAEAQMFNMVNNERSSRGISTLTFDNALTQVGKAHCEDMFARGYFSHYTPEGLSPFDRMNAAGISFSYAGENLALAPNVTLAMQGLMASPGHRENILSPNFGKIGVAVVNGGIYGEMFCQEFTD